MYEYIYVYILCSPSFGLVMAHHLWQQRRALTRRGAPSPHRFLASAQRPAIRGGTNPPGMARKPPRTSTND